MPAIQFISDVFTNIFRYIYIIIPPIIWWIVVISVSVIITCLFLVSLRYKANVIKSSVLMFGILTLWGGYLLLEIFPIGINMWIGQTSVRLFAYFVNENWVKVIWFCLVLMPFLWYLLKKFDENCVLIKPTMAAECIGPAFDPNAVTTIFMKRW